MSYWAPPIIARGTGPLTGGAFHQIVETVHHARGQQAAIAKILEPDFGSGVELWVGLIIATSSVTTRKWRYTLERQELTLSTLTNGTHPDIRMQDAATGGASVYAYNLYEWTQPNANLGDGTQVGHIPAGFSVIAVDGLVSVWTMRDSIGDTIHIFDRANGIDGVCP